MNTLSSNSYRQNTTFYLNTELIKSLESSAAKVNCSLNSYVEMILMDHQCNMPNAETIEAIEEARRGEYAGIVDTSSPEAFLKSFLEDEED